MKLLKFKTNISCDGCVANVTPFLNSNPMIKKWKVDTSNPDKVLTVEGEKIDEQNIIITVQKAGYKISPL
ncbi:MAG: heavy-metal-associated domain-containing protein [Bacteroidota bacterium]